MDIQERPLHGIASAYHLVVVAAGGCAITATYVLTLSSVADESKFQGAWLIVAGFLIVYLGLHRRREVWLYQGPVAVNDAASDALEKLDDAGDVFSGSITMVDLFRVVASRIREVVPAGPIALYVQDKTRAGLELEETDGADETFAADAVTAQACFGTCTVTVGAHGVVAIPLTNRGEPFGVLELHFAPGKLPNESERWLLDAIGTRVSGMISNSMAFERSVSNALMDMTTELPNERALYLILENQIAESQRKRRERPLTVLAIDICGFDEINRKFGHAAGDRALTFVAEAVRDNLRQMDFLVRCNDDEFLAVLPTASKAITQEIIERITTALFGRTMMIADGHSIGAELNFGWAVFGEDGETSEQLITAARLSKDRKKMAVPPNILWFPRHQAS